MNEDLNPEDNKPKKESREEEKIREAKKAIERIAEIEKEMRSSDELKTYFSNYDADSVEHFISLYARNKYSWHRYSKFNLAENEKEDLQWIEQGEFHLSIIQKKKMFNAQCLWRAGELEIKEVDMCFDFVLWDKFALYCPFIEPISEEEVEMYMNYMNSNNVELERGWISDWQDYNSFKDRDSGYPDWYDYYDMRKGTGSLLLLPDLKGTSERLYFKLSGEDLKKNRAKTVVSTPQKPRMKPVFDNVFMNWFVNKFEDKKTIKYYFASKRNFRHAFEADFIMDQIELLLKSGEKMPFEPAIDWRTSLELTVERYKLKKIAEFLPLAYEEYKMKLSMNPITDVDHIRKMNEVPREHFTNLILKGRELNGEPRDFNY